MITKNEWMRREYYKRKEELITLLGGQCVRCASTSKSELQFDHIEREGKTDKITSLITYKRERVLEELKKCQLLCKSCHNEKTRDELGRARHGTIYMYRRFRCRCEPCRVVWNRKSKEWKIKSLRSGRIDNPSVSETEDSRFEP